MNAQRKLKTLAATAVAGGAAAYFFDAANGRTRRTAFANRVTRVVEDVRHARSKVDEIRAVVARDDTEDTTEPIAIPHLGGVTPLVGVATGG